MRRLRQTRVADLPDLFDSPAPRPALHCLMCGNSYSAHKGDYFDADPNAVFTCCDQPMQLGTMRNVFTPARRLRA